jgi:hypothetical protein
VEFDTPPEESPLNNDVGGTVDIGLDVILSIGIPDANGAFIVPAEKFC